MVSTNKIADSFNEYSSGEDFEGDDYNIHSPVWTHQYLRSSAIHLKLVRPRSLAWASLLDALPLLPGDLVVRLSKHRTDYENLKKTYTKDPRSAVGDDPLSQKDESLWNQHFCDNELKALILQDVVRTFPDEEYFRSSKVQDLMVCVLFVWARANSNIGYRQGMHEILAPLLLELYYDRKYAPRNLSDVLRDVLKYEYLEHDSYMLFNAVMGGLQKFYTTGDVVPTACGRLPTSKTLHNPNDVVRYLDKVKEEHLAPLDPELAAHLTNCNISLELFGIRWLRLLFGREFPRSEVSNLWSYLFSEGPALPNLHYVVIAMLISMRKTLLDPDPGVVLSTLMRPAGLNVGHVIALALHLSLPSAHLRPTTPPPRSLDKTSQRSIYTRTYSIEEHGTVKSDGSGILSSNADIGADEGVPEGADVARELATLALLRAQLPAAAAALTRALPRPPPNAVQPLSHILQLSALLQCRNHALVDVETALEAAEGHTSDRIGQRHLVPIMVTGVKRGASSPKQIIKTGKKTTREVQLKVFNQVECDSSESNLPCLDPLRLRAE